MRIVIALVLSVVWLLVDSTFHIPSFVLVLLALVKAMIEK